jgi:hypothetical protein
VSTPFSKEEVMPNPIAVGAIVSYFTLPSTPDQKLGLRQRQGSGS